MLVPRFVFRSSTLSWGWSVHGGSQKILKKKKRNIRREKIIIVGGCALRWRPFLSVCLPNLNLFEIFMYFFVLCSFVGRCRGRNNLNNLRRSTKMKSAYCDAGDNASLPPAKKEEICTFSKALYYCIFRCCCCCSQYFFSSPHILDFSQLSFAAVPLHLHKIFFSSCVACLVRVRIYRP